MARHLPDLGQEVEETQVYTWPIASWRKQDKKVTSPEFECGGHRWSVFPQLLQATENWLIRIQAYIDVPIRQLKCSAK